MCPFYIYQRGSYCQADDKKIYNDMYNTFCRYTRAYEDCPIYKNKMKRR